MNKLKKTMYYTRLITFVISLIIVFLMTKTIVKVGLYGYIFLLFESIYIVVVLLMILSKNKKYENDWAFNTMQIGTYVYQTIVFGRTIDWSVSSIALGSYVFYRNNFIILTILLFTLILYIIAVTCDKKGMVNN